VSPSSSPVPLAQRLAKLPPYLFAEIDKNKREARARGVDLIDMGIGDPDLPTPPHIIEALKRAAETPANHRYPDYEGLLSFRTAVADWYHVRFGVTPLVPTEAEEMIRGIRGVKLLEGVRGEPPADFAVLVEVLLRLAQLAVRHPRIQELDINPFLAASERDAAKAVDVRIRVGPVPDS